MRSIWRTALLTALIAFCAGALGVYAGVTWFGPDRPHTSLDDVVHRELNLSADQNRQIEAIETHFASRKTALEQEMRAATRDIAAAVSGDKTYSDRVERAVDRFHNAMGQLQRETILHVFEMRAVLTPAQQSVCDETVRTELLRSADEVPEP
jgi:Spy/CpxP family protein refolding chaperone